MIKNRLIFSFFLISIVVLLLFFFPLLIFSIATLAICILAAWEWSQFIGFSSSTARLWHTMFYGLLLTIIFLLLPKSLDDIYQPIIFNIFLVSLSWWIFAVFLVIFYPSSAKLWKYSKILRTFLGMLVIIPFFIGMIVLRSWNYEKNYYHGSLWIFYIMIMVWGSDSGAYIFGKLFGTHKFVPKVSPEKTWQGFFGGLLISIILAWCYNFLIQLNIATFKLLTCSIITIIFSVLGDLTESMFKRELGIKNSGKIIPGHGGVLDRIDSLMAAVPVFVLLLLLVCCKN